nr:SEL1-like repeat protein [Bacteroidota bacterium]
MKKYVSIILMVLFTSLGFAQEYYRNWNVGKETKKERIALVIANNHYESNGSLVMPVPTAKKLEKALERQGFDVLVGHDLNRVQMVNILGDFSNKFKTYQFAMVFYLGHGFQIDGDNYLIPVDANPKNTADVEVHAINVEYVLKKINIDAIPKIVVLDACRNNPFTKNWDSFERSGNNDGFDDVNKLTNAEIFFTTQKDSKVRDDNPYVDFLIQEIQQGGCLDDIIRRVSKRLYDNNPDQVAAKYGQLLQRVCFGTDPSPVHNDMDSDGDGVLDNDDACIYEFGYKAYNGCPLRPTLEWKIMMEKYNTPAHVEKSEFEKLNSIDTPEATARLGYLYRRGWGVEENQEKAIQCFKTAAQQSNAFAQFNLGVCCERGLGVPQNINTAVDWYQKAAEQGDANAQNNLGMCYQFGKGVPENLGTAIFWIRKAAEQGDPTAQSNLAMFYDLGDGVKQNIDSAIFWYRKSAGQGNEDAQYYIGDFYCDDENELPVDYKTAVYWFRKSAGQGYSRGQFSLGIMYRYGYGVQMDFDTAVYWYSKVAEHGNSLAINHLINMYEESEDIINTLYWHRKAADQGDTWYQCKLGEIYFRGELVKQDYKSAVTWYRKAAEQGDASGQCSLGYMYENGYGVGKDKAIAKSWYQKACNQGYEPACNNL